MNILEACRNKDIEYIREHIKDCKKWELNRLFDACIHTKDINFVDQFMRLSVNLEGVVNIRSKIIDLTSCSDNNLDVYLFKSGLMGIFSYLVVSNPIVVMSKIIMNLTFVGDSIHVFRYQSFGTETINKKVVLDALKACINDYHVLDSDIHLFTEIILQLECLHRSEYFYPVLELMKDYILIQNVKLSGDKSRVVLCLFRLMFENPYVSDIIPEIYDHISLYSGPILLTKYPLHTVFINRSNFFEARYIIEKENITYEEISNNWLINKNKLQEYIEWLHPKKSARK